MAGTVPYMAPEQIQGRPSTSSDQYSLGVVVYEWLCGRPPFGGSSMEIALQHVSALPPLLREKDPTIPADVEKVVLTALAKEPAQRFGSVQAFATTLEQARQRTPSYVSGPSNSPPGSPAALQAELHGSFGSLPLGPSVVTIGHAPPNQLVIDDLKVSSQHAAIQPLEQGHQIVDLHSTNGTFVNDQLVAPGVSCSLRQGDMIRLGDTMLRYVDRHATPGRAADVPTRRADSRSGENVAPTITPVLPPSYSVYRRGGGGYPPPDQPSATQPVLLFDAVPGIPLPPPQETSPYAPVATASPEGIPAPPIPPAGAKRRVLWLALSLAALLLIVAGSVVGVAAYMNSLPTPAKSLDSFCSALQGKDYLSAYHQLSSTYQNRVPEPLFASFFAPVTSCTHSSSGQVSNSTMATLTTVELAHSTTDQITLVQDNSQAWKIDNDSNLSGLTKTLNTYCTALLHGDDATAYSQFSSQLQTKLSQAQFASLFPQASSCSYATLTIIKGGSTIDLTRGSSSGQSKTELVSLVTDSGGNWKVLCRNDRILQALCTTTGVAFAVGRLGSAVQLHHDARGNRALP